MELPFAGLIKGLDEFVNGELTDLEKLLNLQQDVLDEIRNTEDTIDEITARGNNRPDLKSSAGLPLDLELAKERLELLLELFEKVERRREVLKTGAITSDTLRPQPLQENIRTMFPATKIEDFRPSQVTDLREELQFIRDHLDQAIKLRNESLKGISEQDSTIAKSNQGLIESIKQTTNEYKNQGQAVTDTNTKLQNLSSQNKDVVQSQEQVNQTIKNGSAVIDNVGISADKVTEVLNNVGETFGGIGKGSEVVGKNLDKISKSVLNNSDSIAQAEKTLDNYGGTTKDVTESTKNLSQEGLQGVTDQAGQAMESLDSMGTSVEAVDDAAKTAADGGINEFTEKVEDLNQSGGFFEGIKQGFIDFVENVQSNSELMADFFADTLSQMSQSFSDLFFNLITGKFDDLKDLAKQTFEAILRAFLDLVSAIATRQIVISIAGVFGLGKGAQAAGGGGNPTDIAQQGAGVIGSGLGLFGSGGAFETLGAEEKEYRLAA